MNYRMEVISDSTATITAQRKTVGWVRKGETGWVATMGTDRGEGPTAIIAFRSLFDRRREADAKAAGFTSYASMVADHNRKVRAEVDRRNAELAELGLPALWKTRRSRH